MTTPDRSPARANHPHPTFCAAAGILCLLAAALSLGGCGWTTRGQVAVDLPTDLSRLAIDVDNFSGNVDVVVDPDAEEASVTYSLSTDGLWRSEEERKAGYERVGVTAEIIEQDGGAVLVARSYTDDPTNPDHRTHLRIVVPRCDGVRVHNARGDVELVNVAGVIEVENHMGSVELRTETPMTWPVTITTVEGNIYYQVPAGSSGMFDLLSLEGEASYKDEVGGTEKLMTNASTTTATLNAGDNPVVCRTNRGDVRVFIMENPTALTRAYKKTLPDTRDALWLQGKRRYTRNLPTGEARTVTVPSFYED